MSSDQSDEGDQLEGTTGHGGAEVDHEHDDAEEADSELASSGPSASGPACSVVEYYGPHVGDCGYCHRSPRESGTGRRSYDMDTSSLTAADYQELLDRGWRRSGTFCYRVNNPDTCCPNYSIICRATEFHLTRSHRRCIEKVLSYLATGDAKSRVSVDYTKGPPQETTWSRRRKRAKTLDELKQSAKLRDKRYLRSIERKASRGDMNQDEAAECIRKKWEDRLMPTLPLESYLFPTTAMLGPNAVESFKPKHTLRVDMVYVDSRRCRVTRGEQQRMLVRYQDVVHKDPHREWTMDRFCNFLVHTPIITERMTNYDHLNQSDEAGTLGADVDSSPDHLFFQPPQLPTAYGSYHCNYYLNDKLIATGVLDVLPKCITTVYFFYDPKFAFLNLGIFSALVEISMVRRMSRHYTGEDEHQLIDYYLGMYVHESKKMHYKTRFQPSYLLCSKTNRYVSTQECLQKLSDGKYADFADDEPEDEDSGRASPGNKHKILQLLQVPVESPITPGDTQMMSFLRRLAATLNSDMVDLFINGYLSKYVELVGPELSPRLKLKVNVVYQSLKARYERLTSRDD